MSSRDRSDRPKDSDRSSGNANANRPSSASDWDFDPAEIDRYLSGRSSSSRPSSGSSSRSGEQPERSSTAESLERLRRARDQQQRTQRAAGRPTTPSTPSTGSTVPPAARATRPATPQDQWPAPRTQQPADDTAGPAWDETPFPEEPLDDATGAAQPSRLAGRMRAPRRSFTLPRPSGVARPTMPVFIQRADLANDAAALALLGLSLLSLAIMAILVANRIDVLANPFATHVNASGGLEHYEKNTAIWRLPLLSGMFLLMNLVAAWFISPTDRFLSRFLLGVSCVVQLVVWIALIRFLW